MPTIQKKYGHAPFVASDSDLAFSEVFQPTVRTGADWGNYGLVDGSLYDFDFPWGMLGNDKVGDCEVAGAIHGQMLDNAEGERAVPEFDEDGAIGIYSAIGGYDPKKPSTDQGLSTRETLSFRRKKGFGDARKHDHRIGIFGTLDYRDVDLLDEVGAKTGKIAIGTAITTAAAEQFDRCEPFHLTGDDELDGYHCVYIVGKLAGNFVVSTWGTLALMTPSYLQAQGDEAWAYATGAQINSESGETLAGLDVEKARAFIAGLEKE